MTDTEIALLKEFIRLQRGVIELAVTESPEAAVDMVAEYFEEAGVDDDETRRMLDMWWASRRREQDGEPKFNPGSRDSELNG